MGDTAIVGHRERAALRDHQGPNIVNLHVSHNLDDNHPGFPIRKNYQIFPMFGTPPTLDA